MSDDTNDDYSPDEVERMRQVADGYKDLITRNVDARLRAIAGNEEKIVEAWVAQHGWKPDECMLMRQDMADGTMRMWIEKRGDFDELKRFREREPLVQALVEGARIVATACTVRHALLGQEAAAVLDFGSCSSSAADIAGAAAETAGHSLEGNAQTRETTEE